MEPMPPPSPLGLYLHVPFCASICGYCNFNRGLFDPALKAAYVEAIRLEIRRAADGAAADTIYFGGGTPSLLEPAEVGAIIGECRAAFAVAAGAEITLEANPETVTRASLAAFREHGVNRISFGVQSFRDEELRRLDRAHSAGRARLAFADARAAGFENLSLDLMLWLPGQTCAHVEESLDGLLALGPEHASVYLLELYPNAPLRETMARAGWSQAPDDDAADMYLMAMERLEEGGLEQYEISNLAAPGRRCQHNLKYWTDGEWAGFGPGAHSTRHRVRWNNVSGTLEYTRRIEAGEPVVASRRSLGPRDALEEALFMGLRLCDGVSCEALGARYGVDIWAVYGERLEPAIDAGLLIRQGECLRLTRPGMLMANEVMAAFLRTDSTVE
ncbi:MAG: radical SAM family heme chaperone HemW [Acidobacteria bacterium]|nr:radical SAM family heme chaperone HemW [Acidobacteriota bacterium]